MPPTDNSPAAGQTNAEPALVQDLVIRVGAGDDAATVGQLCDRLRALIEQSAGGPVMCDVDAQRAPDLRAVDALARLQLTARRLGRSICLREASPELLELIDFAGLRDALPARREG